MYRYCLVFSFFFRRCRDGRRSRSANDRLRNPALLIIYCNIILYRVTLYRYYYNNIYSYDTK